MLALAVFAAALAALLWGVSKGRHRSRGTGPALAAFALGSLALRGLLQIAALPGARANQSLIVALAAAAALVAWAAMARLAAHAPRRRDAFLRAPFAVIAGMLALGGAPISAIAVFASVASLAYRWRDGLPTLRLFRLALGAIVLAIALGWSAPDLDLVSTSPPALAVLASFARLVRTVALVHAWLAVPVLLGAFLRDPSLGIRTVGRRLALSHVLVVVVPLALVCALWAFTTVLGVNSDRAQVGARAVEAEGRQLASVLRGALARPTVADSGVAALPSTYADRWPGLRVWRVRDGRVRRVSGEPARAESTFAGWTARLDSLPASAVLGEAEGRFLGAAARAPGGRDDALVALVPLDSVLAHGPSIVAGARLRVEGGAMRPYSRGVGIGEDVSDGETSSRYDPTAGPPPTDSLRRTDPADSARLERARRVLRTLGLPDSALQAGTSANSGVRITADGTTFAASGSDSGEVSFLLRGYALLNGLRRVRGTWSTTSYLLSASASPGEVIGGLFRNARRSQINYLPLVFIGMFTVLALFVALFDIGMVTSMGRSITAAIQALKVGARRLESGDLAHRIPVRGDDDLWEVAATFNEASAGLERARELEKEAERLESELALARRIQARLLPAGAPDVPGLEIAGLSQPAREVGGDYFDHIPLGDGRVMLVVADVSGKGVGAALLMSAFRASLMSQDSANSPPDVLAGRLNEFLHRSVEPGKFVTAFVAFLDGRDGRLVYANAGHNPPVLLRRDGTHDMLATGGLILGIMPGSTFECGEARLEPGDLVALYTDGVTEGADADGEQWGEERLLATLRARSGERCAGMVRGIVDTVRAFEGESGPADDITLLVARRV